ncbi:PLP-dependent aminotransferase family protein [Tropicimonas sp. IMCC34043]|uniref:MocR-like ectoine utilization transcription factor EhuR n=1 Tax=Tropicimonas sp. IMCC34043 TaxID=2248760 RepID=UPI000E27738D|nr:PLP-dependent aminotransferase family protein [Tropicimonas sp. IMCC34043]
MSLWPPDPSTLTRPAYRSLAQQLTAAIEAGELPPGTRLPTQRDLADSLGLSLQTVGRAYDALIRSNLIAGHVGRGTFVTARAAEGSSIPFQRLERGADVIDCSMLTPVMDDLHREAMREAMVAVAGRLSPDALFSFRARQSVSLHTRATLDWLQRCGIRTNADRVVTTNGCTAAITLALISVAAPGDLILCDEMSHHMLGSTARYLGLRLGTVASDNEAMDPGALAKACETSEPKALFLMPSGAHPETRVMDLNRRSEICRIARKFDLKIIENDAWGPLEQGRPSPLAALAPDLVFYITGLTKCLMPGMRVGWLVVPDRSIHAVTSRNLALQWMATTLMSELAAHWISEGTAERLLQWQRQALARRNRIARKVFDGLPIRSNPRGLHVWLPLDRAWEADAFVMRARQDGIATASGRAFAMGERYANGVRICLGAPSEHDLNRALVQLRRLAESPAEPSYFAI